jgi:hypothetical protein
VAFCYRNAAHGRNVASRQHITGCSAPFGRCEIAIDQ